MSYWDKLRAANPEMASSMALTLTPAELKRLVDKAEQYGRDEATRQRDFMDRLASATGFDWLKKKGGA